MVASSSAFVACALDELPGKGCDVDVLVITPLYPSAENPYACAFVHTRVLAYLKAGLSVRVVSRAFDGVSGHYMFEGVTVYRLSMNDLQTHLRNTTYRCIGIHFIENEYARVLESCDLSSSHLLIWCHGAESLYWDRPKFTTSYFSAPRIMDQQEVADLQARDAMLARFNARPNTTFVFVSEFARRRSTELTGITWNNAVVIPNPLDFDLYSYHEKSPELRTKVFCAKTHDDSSCYAMDTVVRTIVALSRRPCFEKLSFTIVGTGNVHDKLIAPLRAFQNVDIVERFFTRDEMAAAHREHGVALFPTRFDTQGVSMCEAAASGLAVVSSKRDSVAAFLADDAGLLVPVDDFAAYADVVERLCEDPAYFEACSRASYEKISAVCAPAATIDREVALIRDCLAHEVGPRKGGDVRAENAPVLSIGVLGASEHDVAAFGQMSHVADGVVEVFSIAEISDLAARARGRYVKALGARDFVDPENLSALVEYLSHSSSHVVLTDIWDLAPGTEDACRVGGYHFMVPGQVYEHADLDMDTYGFGDTFPAARFGVFEREWFVAAQSVLGADDLTNESSKLAELAETLSYVPLAAFHYRLSRSGDSSTGAEPVQNERAGAGGRLSAIRSLLRKR